MQIYFLDFEGDHHFYSTITARNPKRQALRRLKSEVVANAKAINEDN